MFTNVSWPLTWPAVLQPEKLPFSLHVPVTLFTVVAQIRLWSVANFRNVAMKKTNSVCDILSTSVGGRYFATSGRSCFRLTTSGEPGEGGGTFAAEDLQENPGEMPPRKPQINREKFLISHSSDEVVRTYFAFGEYLGVWHHWERGSGCPRMLSGLARIESCPGGQRKVKD